MDPTRPGEKFWTRDLICLFHSKEQTSLITVDYGSCHFVLSTSPKRNLLNDFVKNGCSYYYMPVWDKAEMEAVAPMYPNAIDWEDSYNILGGIPRFVFQQAVSVERAKTLVRDAVGRSNTNDLFTRASVDDMLTLGYTSKYFHRAVHIMSYSPFVEHTFKFSSDFASVCACQKNREEVQRFLNDLVGSEYPSQLGTFVGTKFQEFALQKLQAGGEFECVELFGGGSRKPLDPLHIHPKRHVTSDKVRPTDEDYVLYEPRSKTFAGIDAWMPGIGGFQITINLKHEVNKSLANDLPKLRGGAHKLIWVLRENEFKHFKYRPIPEKYRKLKQYAIKIPEFNRWCFQPTTPAPQLRSETLIDPEPSPRSASDSGLT